ncbi:MAG: prephenate dehydratase [Chloroflexi bacterium]|nr:MAG: prephenate dehydratase [Chloroflexota bacterium]
MKIAYLGPAGTFSEVAALLTATPEDELIPFASFPALVSAVETGIAQVAVLPIENSIEGSVSTTVDLLIHETSLLISREVVVPVHHFLVGPPGAKITDIKTVHSHPQALGQCRRFLERCLPNAHQSAALSTAGSVADVVRAGDTSVAAIGPLRAAELYGGEVLARNIEDNHLNVTRFVALSEHDHAPTGADRTSFCATIPSNVPGSLHALLTELAVDNIQMTKLESRPAKGLLGEYFFLIDIEGHRTDERIAGALERIRAKADTLKIFGSYPRFTLENGG